MQDNVRNPKQNGEINPKTQSKFEPVAEPASSTGEPTLKPIPEGWSGWRTADGEPLKDAPYGPNGMEGDYGL